jgi:hypothetical protein
VGNLLNGMGKEMARKYEEKQIIGIEKIKSKFVLINASNSMNEL